MEGLEFDVYAARPQTSLDLKGSRWVKLSVSTLGYFWKSEGLEEESNCISLTECINLRTCVFSGAQGLKINHVDAFIS